MSQVITNAFETYWQGCLTEQQPVILDEMVLADIPNLDITAPIDPNTGLPPLAQIVHRHQEVQRGRINNNAVAYSIVMDTTVGNFTFNAMYLINKATGIVGMIVYKGRETKTRTDPATGTTGNSLVKSMLMEYDQAATATVTTVEAGTWQIDYSARLNGMEEQVRLHALTLFGSAAFFDDGFQLVNHAGAYKVLPGVAIVGGLRIQLDTAQAIAVSTMPLGVWVDVYRAGTILSHWENHIEITTSAVDLADYTDSHGYRHYVAKLGVIDATGAVTDQREVNKLSSLWDELKAHARSNDHPSGTQDEKGMLRLATLAETQEGLLSSVPVAPKELHATIDAKLDEHSESRDHPSGTQDAKGMLRLATLAEALAGLLSSVPVAPKELHAAIDAKLRAASPFKAMFFADVSINGNAITFIKNNGFLSASVVAAGRVRFVLEQPLPANTYLIDAAPIMTYIGGSETVQPALLADGTFEVFCAKAADGAFATPGRLMIKVYEV